MPASAAVPGPGRMPVSDAGTLLAGSAFALFVAAAVTDWLDGYLARAWEQQSTLAERMLDPIADKLIVGAALMMLVHDNTING